MSELTFRNRLGALVDITTVPASEVKNKFGAISEKAALGGIVAITKHHVPKFVLIGYEEFKALVQGRGTDLSQLTSEFDSMLEELQTPKARKGLAHAFEASPEQMGRAAVRAARKEGKKKLRAGRG